MAIDVPKATSYMTLTRHLQQLTMVDAMTICHNTENWASAYVLFMFLEHSCDRSPDIKSCIVPYLHAYILTNSWVYAQIQPPGYNLGLRDPPAQGGGWWPLPGLLTNS